MEGETSGRAQETHMRQSLPCRWLRNGSAILWGLLIPGLLLSVLGSLLFFRWPWSSNPHIAEEGSAVRWAIENPAVFLGCGVGLLLLTILIFLGCRSKGSVSSVNELPPDIAPRIEQISHGHSVIVTGNMTGRNNIVGDHNRIQERDEKQQER
jgi:hypothetical protein